MKTLYISDLDGTLIRSDERTSEYTNRTINRLVGQGMLFTYATARSWHTAHKVTAGMEVALPIVIYNGVMIANPRDGSFIAKNTFGDDIRSVVQELVAHDVYPAVYAFVDGKERFTLMPARRTRGMLALDEPRINDVRRRAVQDLSQLWEGDIYNITCIDKAEKLLPFFEKYQDRYHCIYQLDLYSGEPWLEILPKSTSKAQAIRQLKSMLGFDKVVVFGDGINDVEMFEMADEAYAMANAVPELKAIATAVIDGNNEDGVARWLEQNAQI